MLSLLIDSYIRSAKIQAMKRLTFLIICALSFTLFQCKRVGCMQNIECVDNYDPKAVQAGDCSGCTDIVADNYCNEAQIENGKCLFKRQFYSNFPDHGWIDIWVADSTNEHPRASLVYEGRITLFPKQIPICENGDSVMKVTRAPGEYYYEIETQTGQRGWGNVIFRREGCRLLDVY